MSGYENEEGPRSYDASGVDVMQDVRAFHRKFGLVYEGRPRQLPEEFRDFRIKFLEEELIEYRKASDLLTDILAGRSDMVPPGTTREDFITQLLSDCQDSLLDLIYVAVGTAELHGFLENGIFAEGWRRVQRANMSKVRAERVDDSKRGSTFDVVKPADFVPPTHDDLLAAHIHRDDYPSDGSSLRLGQSECPTCGQVGSHSSACPEQ